MAETMKLDIFRYRSEKESEPTFQTFKVPFHEDWVVLDAINHIRMRSMERFHIAGPAVWGSVVVAE